MNFKTKADYKQALGIVRKVIAAWDPYCLLETGAPEDEFDHEVALVTAQIPQMKSESDAIQAISRVFSSNFERELFKPEQCKDVGARLFCRLKEARFV